MPVVNLSENQPHLVVNLGDEVHVIAVADIRMLANGAKYHGDAESMIRLLAKVAIDGVEGATT